MSEDLYAILGLTSSASDAEIRRAYKKLARKHHPDLNPGDADAEERFKRLSAAFEVLSKSEKRALYDELGADAEKIGYDPERAKEYREWKQRAEAASAFDFGDRSTGYGDLEDLLGDIFRGRGPRRGADHEATLQVSFEDAARGTTASVEIGGAKGRVEIPMGVESGTRLRLGGKGAPGRDGGPPGDLYVRIEVAPHSLFAREGIDLVLELPITIAEALVGASIEIPTLTGRVVLKVPASATNGQRLRLRGKGITKGKTSGDLIVTLSLVMPTGGDETMREQIAADLRPLYEGQDVRGGLSR